MRIDAGRLYKHKYDCMLNKRPYGSAASVSSANAGCIRSANLSLIRPIFPELARLNGSEIIHCLRLRISFNRRGRIFVCTEISSNERLAGNSVDNVIGER